MDLLGVTSTETIRAVLGVAEAANELPDSYFTDRNMVGALRLELSSWLPASLEVLSDAASAADEGDPEILVWDAVQQAAAYWCAWECTKTAPMALFQSLEDGNNKVVRPIIKQKELLDLLLGSYTTYRDQALDKYSGKVAIVTAPWLSGKSTPSFDPIPG